jgi:glycosyltransferase involved in cell wall biosynthesis
LRVSVVIPTYNRASVLGRAIDSVLAQTYTNFEVIVVDDGSTDNTQELLSKYEDRIVTITQPNAGVSCARNNGVLKSSGEWIAFLDSDDSWLPNKLELQMKYIDSNPRYNLVHGEEIWIRNGKRVNPKNKHAKSGGDIFLRSLELCLISPSAVILKKDLYNRMEGFREDYEVCEDYDLWLKICSLEEVGFITTPIINKFGGHEDQLSRKFFAMDFWRVKSIKWILENRDLSIEKREHAKEVLLQKTEVLINGYNKHKNFENIEEVSKIREFALNLH